MKKLILLFLVLFAITVKSYSQMPSFCFVTSTNHNNGVFVVSSVLDPQNFEGKNWQTKELAIIEAAKKALDRAFGSKAYEYKSSIEVWSKLDGRTLFTNKYDADKMRSEMIKQFVNYKVFDMKVTTYK